MVSFLVSTSFLEEKTFHAKVVVRRRRCWIHFQKIFGFTHNFLWRVVLVGGKETPHSEYLHFGDEQSTTSYT